jgi:hypothetical protein
MLDAVHGGVVVTPRMISRGRRKPQIRCLVAVSGIAISYRREDTEGSAGRLFDRLVARYGEDFIFVDLNSIEPAADWLRTIDETIRSSSIVIALIGPRYLSVDSLGRRRLDDERDYVRREIRTAIEHGVRLLPVLVQGANMVAGDSLPTDIRALSDVQPAHLDSRYYDQDIGRLFRTIDEMLGFGQDVPRWDRAQTAVAAFVGLADSGPVNKATLVSDWKQYRYTFGDPKQGCFLAHAVRGWFVNGGGECWVVRVGAEGPTFSTPDLLDGLLSLEEVESVTILAGPDLVGGHTDLRGQVEAQAAMIAHCEHMGDRLAILDLPQLNVPDVIEFVKRVARWDSMHAVLYYPWVRVMDPTSGLMISVPPSGHVAGCWARNDRERGVWNAPANLAPAGALDVSEVLTQSEISFLQPAGINVIRPTNPGLRVWGSWTTTQSSRYRDIGAIRLICALERFIIKATSWAAFQPSNVRTWHRLETNVRVILESLWKQGAFAGGSTEEAFYVTCDENVNPLEVSEAGKIRIEFGFRHASLADFVHIMVEQPTGSSTLFAE